MVGETDLAAILRGLTVARRPDRYTLITLPAGAAVPSLAEDGIGAVISEAEGMTVVVTVEEADARGWAVDFVAAWLTLEVHSSLDAVGLTAAVAAALATEGISTNVLAAYFHDHLLVPEADAELAIETLHRLRSPAATDGLA